MGRLKFCLLVVGNYKWIVKPIERLLKRLGQVWWKREHTDALNELVHRVWTRLCIGIIDMTKPA